MDKLKTASAVIIVATFLVYAVVAWSVFYSSDDCVSSCVENDEWYGEDKCFRKCDALNRRMVRYQHKNHTPARISICSCETFHE